jgi:hypothetical protein
MPHRLETIDQSMRANELGIELPNFHSQALQKLPSSSPLSPLSPNFLSQTSPSIESMIQETDELLDSDTPTKYVPSVAILDSNDPVLFPVHTMMVTCCHCDNFQNLLEEWNPYTGEHRAVCNNCTWAFCLRCQIEPNMNAVLFKGGKAILPKLPSADFRWMFIWLCSTCGTDETINDKRIRQRSAFATVDLKIFRCTHCSQSASRGCIFLAMVVPWLSTKHDSQSWSLSKDQPPGFGEDGTEANTPDAKKGSRAWTSVFKKFRSSHANEKTVHS